MTRIERPARTGDGPGSAATDRKPAGSGRKTAIAVGAAAAIVAAAVTMLLLSADSGSDSATGEATAVTEAPEGTTPAEIPTTSPPAAVPDGETTPGNGEETADSTAGTGGDPTADDVTGGSSTGAPVTPGGADDDAGAGSGPGTTSDTGRGTAASQAAAERVVAILREEVLPEHPELDDDIDRVIRAFEQSNGTPATWPAEVPRVSSTAVLSAVFDGRHLHVQAVSAAPFAQIARELQEGYEATGKRPTVVLADGMWRSALYDRPIRVAVSVDDRSPFASVASPTDPARDLLRTIDILVVYEDNPYTPPPAPLP